MNCMDLGYFELSRIVHFLNWRLKRRRFLQLFYERWLKSLVPTGSESNGTWIWIRSDQDQGTSCSSARRTTELEWNRLEKQYLNLHSFGIKFVFVSNYCFSIRTSVMWSTMPPGSEELFSAKINKKENIDRLPEICRFENYSSTNIHLWNLQSLPIEFRWILSFKFVWLAFAYRRSIELLWCETNVEREKIGI